MYCSKAKLISLYRVEIFTFTPILRYIEWKLWTSIKVSRRLGQHLRICFLILLFFLQFAGFKLNAPPYSKTLHYLRILFPALRRPLVFQPMHSCAQGSRKSKISWELTKNGCHVRSPGLSKKPYMCSFQTNYTYYRGFYSSS